MEKAFTESLTAFEGEDKGKPEELMKKYLQAEEAIAKLQAAQAQYNTCINCTISPDEVVTLCYAVKALGGLARAEKMWRKAIGNDERTHRYYGETRHRDPNMKYPIAQVSPEAAVEMATVAAKRASAYRAAIAVANAVEFELPSLTADLVA